MAEKKPWAHKASLAEVRHKIEEAFSLSPRMTVAMLQAFLTSRIEPHLRDQVLERLYAEGTLRKSTQMFHSYTGNSSTAVVIQKVDPQGRPDHTG